MLNISGKVAAVWKVVANVSGNFQRKRVHNFGEAMHNVSAVRVNVTRTNGILRAHINEIRLYGVDGMSPFPSMEE